jgi:hypothetical protein
MVSQSQPQGKIKIEDKKKVKIKESFFMCEMY